MPKLYKLLLIQNILIAQGANLTTGNGNATTVSFSYPNQSS